MSAAVVLIIGAALIIAAIVLAIPTIVRQTGAGRSGHSHATSTSIPLLAWVLLIVGFVIELIGIVVLLN
jgi:hypothetical protein